MLKCCARTPAASTITPSPCETRCSETLQRISKREKKKIPNRFLEENDNKNIGNLSEVIFILVIPKKLKQGFCVSGSMQEMTKDIVIGLFHL